MFFCTSGDVYGSFEGLPVSDAGLRDSADKGGCRICNVKTRLVC